MNPLIQTLLNQLKSKNANGYNMFNNIMQNGGNPEAILKQMMGNMKPEQRQQVLNQAKGYGVPENILAKIQNMK